MHRAAVASAGVGAISRASRLQYVDVSEAPARDPPVRGREPQTQSAGGHVARAESEPATPAAPQTSALYGRQRVYAIVAICVLFACAYIVRRNPLGGQASPIDLAGSAAEERPPLTASVMRSADQAPPSVVVEALANPPSPPLPPPPPPLPQPVQPRVRPLVRAQKQAEPDPTPIPATPVWPLSSARHSGTLAPPPGPRVRPQGLYNLARLPPEGRVFHVTVAGQLPFDLYSGESDEPAPGLRVLLGQALGRTGIRFKATPPGAEPDIVLVGNSAMARTEIAGPGRAALVIAFATVGDPGGPGTGGDGTVSVAGDDAPLAPQGPSADRPLDRDRVLELTSSLLDSLFVQSETCTEGAPPAPPGRTRGTGTKPWCAAACRSITAMYVHALQRGSAKATGRAVFATFGDDAAVLRGCLYRSGARGAPVMHSFCIPPPSPRRDRRGPSDRLLCGAARLCASRPPRRRLRRGEQGRRRRVRGGGRGRASTGRRYGPRPLCGRRRAWKPHLLRRVFESAAHAANGDVVLLRCASRPRGGGGALAAPARRPSSPPRPASDASNKVLKAPTPYLSDAGSHGACTFQRVRWRRREAAPPARTPAPTPSLAGRPVALGRGEARGVCGCSPRARHLRRPPVLLDGCARSPQGPDGGLSRGAVGVARAGRRGGERRRRDEQRVVPTRLQVPAEGAAPARRDDGRARVHRRAEVGLALT